MQITLPELKDGEIYGGAIINPDGKGHYFILLAGDKDECTQNEAMAWAKELGGDLPNRVEQSLLYDKNKEQFKLDWYWSNTQHASYSAYAWCQFFDGGNQNGWFKGHLIRARAVRRLPF